jgi:hypothetical protein
MSARMTDTHLATLVRPRANYLRAANLERHTDQAQHYIPTGRALEVLRRVAEAIDDPTNGRAWSLTGPYGAGKSSFAIFLRSLLGPAGPARKQAELALASADPDLNARLQQVRDEAAGDNGFLLATVTCQQEPLGDAIMRALRSGAVSHWSGRMPRQVREALRTAPTDGARALAEAVEQVSHTAPVLLILDEFGKALEHFSGQLEHSGTAAADLFVLQELAERSSGRNASPIFLLTLQHLAFDDYVRQASATQRREWGKVQGRFEDISFLETPEQSLRLVAGALETVTDAPPSFLKARTGWARTSFERAAELGLGTHLPGGASALEACYPMHPLALLALPELCARLGQHGRTLFTFMAGADGATAAAFLERTHAGAGPRATLPTLKLPYVYDFFAGTGHSLAAGVGGSRWREIDERLREAQALPEDDQAVLKTVGLLNLIAQGGYMRASGDLVSFALSDPHRSADPQWKDRLASLETRGWLTFRAYADEYRLWQGSDVDLRGRVTDAREQLRSTSAAELLRRLNDVAPVIAGKHSQRVGMLRYFNVEYADGTTNLPLLPKNDPADGQLIYYVDAPSNFTGTKEAVSRRPVVVAVSRDAVAVQEAAIEVAAALAVLDQQDVVDDRVARRELQDRVADARSRLLAAQAKAFDPNSSEVQYFQLDRDGHRRELDRSMGLSRMLSDVCDAAYPQSPEIRNEMLGRRELTSQGAKARRVLLERMLSYESAETLGMDHFGPERAMYEAVLRHTGLHTAGAEGWSFSPPKAESRLTDLWGAIAQVVNPATDEAVSLDVLYERLQAPPIGIKDGPIPVLLAAWLIQRRDDVAVYEEGTFQPTLTADLLERMLKSPRRFRVKAFNTSGSRGRALKTVQQVLVQTADAQRSLRVNDLRNGSLLGTAAPLLALVRRLPEYTLYTHDVSPLAQAVRGAVLQAREPDLLLFRDLPVACGIAPLTLERRRGGNADEFGARLTEALSELLRAYDLRLARNAEALAREFGLRSDLLTLRAQVASRAAALEDKVLDPKLRTFLFTLQDTGLEDHAWLEAFALAVADRPAQSWRDDDTTRFTVNLRALVAAFRRLEALLYEAGEQAAADGFRASRHIQTRPDGTELKRVLFVDESIAPAVEDFVDELLAKAARKFGAQAGEAVLQALAEKVLSPVPSGEALALPERRDAPDKESKRAKA